MRALLVSLVRLYQRVAPARLRASCRFEPSCSEYTILALQKFGALRGSYKCVGRLLRCRHPHGGVDYP
jgi:putative membrane protein insertion efficiency factor